jgi:RNA methyltransferase, TrmH family
MRVPGQRPPEPDWRRLRDDSRYVLLDGLHAVKHALRFGADVQAILTTDRAGVLAAAESLAPDLVEALQQQLLPLTAAEFATLVSSRQMPPVAGFARRPALDLADLARGGTPVVVLENPRNLGNLGAVVRTAAGFGASGVLTTGSADPWHPAAVRASAGLHFATRVARVVDAAITLTGGPLLAFDRDGDDLRDADIPDTAVLTFGSERRGLSAALRIRADRVLGIPIRDRVSSYNLAASVAVALYHWTCQRRGRRAAGDVWSPRGSGSSLP